MVIPKLGLLFLGIAIVFAGVLIPLIPVNYMDTIGFIFVVLGIFIIIVWAIYVALAAVQGQLG